MRIGTVAVTVVFSLALAGPAHGLVIGLETPVSTTQAAARFASQVLAAVGMLWIPWATFSGIRRRREEWTRREWIRFAYRLGGVGLIMLTGLVMGAMVDRGIYDAMPREYYRWYLVLLLTFTFGGAGGLGHLLHRFAKGP